MSPKSGSGQNNIPDDLFNGEVTGASLTVPAIGKDEKNPIAAGEYTISADKNGDWSGDDQGSMTLVIVQLDLTKTPFSWLPNGGDKRNSRTYRATIIPNNLKGKIKFNLEGVTSHSGYCANAGEESDKDLKFNLDLTGFDPLTEDSAETVEEVNSARMIVECYDFGSFGKLKASTVIKFEKDPDLTVNAFIVETDGDIYDYATVPRDEVGTDDRKGNEIADSWEKKHVGTVDEDGNWSGGIWQKMYKNSQDSIRALAKADDDEPRDPDGDRKKLSPHATSGDALSVLEEYRGFVFKTRESWGGTSGHNRLSPCRKELLMQVERMIGFKDAVGKNTLTGTINVVDNVLNDSLGADLYYVVDNVSLPHKIFDPRTNPYSSFAKKHRKCDLDNKINYEKFVYFAFVDKDDDAEGISYKGMCASICCGTAIKGCKEMQPLGISLVQYYGYIAAHETGHVLKLDHWDGSSRLLMIVYNNVDNLWAYRLPAHILVLEDIRTGLKVEISLYKAKTMAQLVAEINKHPAFQGTSLTDQSKANESSWSLNLQRYDRISDDWKVYYHSDDRYLMEIARDNNDVEWGAYLYYAIIKPQFKQYKEEVPYVNFKNKW